MISSTDKAILGTVGVLLTGITGSASAFAWRMMNADARLDFARPGAVVASLEGANGTVKTRHRETLAWTNGELKQALREGDRIRTLTDAHATVHYAQGLEVTLDPNSQITVHGPDGKGETLIAAIDVVDGSIRARVENGASFSLRDANGNDKGSIRSTDGAAEVMLTAPEAADGAIGVTIEKGQKVAVASALDQMPAIPGATPPPGGTSEAWASHAVFMGAGESRSLGMPTPIPTTTIARPIATPVPPLEPGLLPVVTFEANDVRFRITVPPGVVAVEVKGKPAPIYEKENQFEVALYGLPDGLSNIDILYRHKDGSWTRQVQRIRVFR